jgi:predicted nuclease of restriction endonuclease-like (RecB) superfamily
MTKLAHRPDFYDEVRALLNLARQKAYASINFAMVEAYWQIGRRIVEEEQNGKERADYGAFLIKELSRQLTGEFGKGFTVANLWNFRQFYLAFPDEKLYTLRRELTWSHYRLIMRVDNPKARAYYLREAAEQNWSTRQLERNIHTLYYERLLTSSEKALAGHVPEKPSLAEFVKDPYVLEFLNIPETPDISERELETAIISNLQHFLLEFGKGFSFVGRQFRISTETIHFYIDLVFYNYLLKCFVLIALKTEKLTHQAIGQMDMYVRMFDDLKRGEDDNPTVGIIFCTAKDETVVKYSVLKDSEQLFASKYRLILPTEEELAAEIERERRMIMERRAAYRVN